MSKFIPHKAAPTIRRINAAVPTLFFTPAALRTMQCYVEECSDEIGWLGIVEEYDNSQFLCTEVHLLYQEVGGATTEIQPDGLVKYAEEVGMDNMENVRLWGHSHVNMGTGASGQDESQMELFKKNGFPWYFRIIGNKKGSMSVSFFNFKDAYIVDDVQWDVYYPTEVNLDTIKAEIQQKVSKLRSAYTYGEGWSGHGYGKYDDYEGYWEARRSYSPENYTPEEGAVRWFSGIRYMWSSKYGKNGGWIQVPSTVQVEEKKQVTSQTPPSGSTTQQSASAEDGSADSLNVTEEDLMEELEAYYAEAENMQYDALIMDIDDALAKRDIYDMIEDIGDFSNRDEVKIIMQTYGVTYPQLKAICKITYC